MSPIVSVQHVRILRNVTLFSRKQRLTINWLSNAVFFSMRPESYDPILVFWWKICPTIEKTFPHEQYNCSFRVGIMWQIPVSSARATAEATAEQETATTQNNTFFRKKKSIRSISGHKTCHRKSADNTSAKDGISPMVGRSAESSIVDGAKKNRTHNAQHPRPPSFQRQTCLVACG